MLVACSRTWRLWCSTGFRRSSSGVVCEVFGIDRTDDGLPGYDFAVVAGEEGPLRSEHGLALTDRVWRWTGCASADLVVMSAIDRADARKAAGRVSAAAARRAAGHGRARRPGARRVHRRVRAGGGGAAGRPAVHDALAARAVSWPATAPAADRRSGRCCTWTRTRSSPARERRGHRRVPLPGAQGTGHEGGQPDRPADGGRAAPGRRAGAVRGPPLPMAPPTHWRS